MCNLFLLVQGSLSWVTFAFPRYLSWSSAWQHGKEGSKEGSSRSPQGDESDEGKEGVDPSAIDESIAMLPPGWHELAQFAAACICAHSCSLMACSWTPSVVMAGIDKQCLACLGPEMMEARAKLLPGKVLAACLKEWSEVYLDLFSGLQLRWVTALSVKIQLVSPLSCQMPVRPKTLQHSSHIGIDLFAGGGGKNWHFPWGGYSGSLHWNSHVKRMGIPMGFPMGEFLWEFHWSGVPGIHHRKYPKGVSMGKKNSTTQWHHVFAYLTS